MSKILGALTLTPENVTHKLYLPEAYIDLKEIKIPDEYKQLTKTTFTYEDTA